MNHHSRQRALIVGIVITALLLGPGTIAVGVWLGIR